MGLNLRDLKLEEKYFMMEGKAEVIIMIMDYLITSIHMKIAWFYYTEKTQARGGQNIRIII